MRQGHPIARASDPSVVAVVVAHDPGDWFAETLAALAAQDYPGLQIVVVDTGDEARSTDLAEQVRQALPEATVQRGDRRLGFGAAANEVLSLHPDADFFLFAHDDIAPEPDATRALVETARECGAAVVGPKLVSWDDPRRLLQVGVAVDKTGATMPMVERFELDQGQHDGVRQVFDVPGAFTLVRGDLFRRIGGFDESISLLGDDLSLCWRARVAGARVVVTSAAKVRHREALGARLTAKQRQRLLVRHRLRVVLTSYGRVHRLRLVPQMAAASAVVSVGSLTLLRPDRARTTVEAWWWNLRRPRALRAARRHVHQFRQVDDRTVRALQVPGLVRPRLLLQQAGEGVGARKRAIRDRLETWCGGWTRGGVLALLALASVLLLGSRHLLTRGVPPVGEFAPFDAPSDLLREWVSGWRASGLGSEAAAPTALGMVGAVGTLLGGHLEPLRMLLTLGLIPVGIVGALCLLRPTGSRAAPVAAAVAYAAVPVPFAALAAGRWTPLAVYAATPWLLGRLARASGTLPFAGPGGPGVRGRGPALVAAGLTVTETLGNGAAPNAGHPARIGAEPTAARAGLLGHTLVVGIVTALLALVVPAAPLLTVFLALGLATGSLLVFEHRSGLRILLAGLGGAGVAAVLLLPWTLDLLGSWSTAGWWIGPPRPSGPVNLADLLGFSPAAGPLPAAPLTWGLLAGGGVALLVGRAWRLTWAVRAWALALMAWVVAAVADGGLVDGSLPSPDVLLAVAGAAMALAVGCAVAAVEHDVTGRSRRFGLRRTTVALGVVGVLLALVPLAGSSLDGYWAMPHGGFGVALDTLDRPGRHSSRVLWLGDPRAVPVPTWPMARIEGVPDGRVGYALTDGTPTLDDLWPGPADRATQGVAHAVELATSQQTARLGRLLSPLAVEYIVVPQRLGPAPLAAQEWPAPELLVDALAGQLDLERVDVDPSVLVFRNQAVLPTRGAVRDSAVLDPAAASELLGSAPEQSGMWPVLQREAGHGRWVGRLPADVTVFQSVQGSDRWLLEVDGEPVPSSPAFGWANRFGVPDGGNAVLRYDTPATRWIELGLQAAAWIVVTGLAIRVLRRDRTRAATADRFTGTVAVVDSAALPAAPVERTPPPSSDVAGSVPDQSELVGAVVTRSASTGGRSPTTADPAAGPVAPESSGWADSAMAGPPVPSVAPRKRTTVRRRRQARQRQRPQLPEVVESVRVIAAGDDPAEDPEPGSDRRVDAP